MFEIKSIKLGENELSDISFASDKIIVTNAIYGGEENIIVDGLFASTGGLICKDNEDNYINWVDIVSLKQFRYKGKTVTIKDTYDPQLIRSMEIMMSLFKTVPKCELN